MQIQKLIFLQTTGFYLGRSSEQSASLHQAGVIHLETHLGFLVSKKVGTEMLWGVDGVDMDWREKVISTCQVMHFATSCPRVLVIVSCLAELCPQSLSLCFLPQIPMEQYKLFSPHSDPRAVSGGGGGGHTQRWHRAKDFPFSCCNFLSRSCLSLEQRCLAIPSADPSQQPVSSRTSGCRHWINQQSRGSESNDLGGWGMSPSGRDPVKAGRGEGEGCLKSQPAAFPFQPVQLSSIELTSPGWKQGEGRLLPRG